MILRPAAQRLLAAPHPPPREPAAPRNESNSRSRSFPPDTASLPLAREGPRASSSCNPGKCPSPKDSSNQNNGRCRGGQGAAGCPLPGSGSEKYAGTTLTIPVAGPTFISLSRIAPRTSQDL